MEECPKCESKSILSLESAAFVPYRSGKKSVEKDWPLVLHICASCGYTESYVKKEDLPKIKELASRQERLSASVSKGLDVIE